MFPAPNSRGLGPPHPLRPIATGSVARTPNSRLLDAVNVKDFGARGDGVTDDTRPIQDAINAAQTIAAGAEVYLPAGRYRVTQPLSISKHVAITGAGPQNIGNLGGQFQSGGGVTNVSSVSAGTAILPSSNNSAFSINTPDAVMIRDLEIAYLTVAGPATGTTAISFATSSGTSNWGSLVDNVCIAGADRGIQFTNCLSQTVRDCNFWECQSYGIYVDNTSGSSIASVGDYLITGNTFVSGSTASVSHFFCQSGGGMKIIGNKLNAAGSVNQSYGINISPQSAGVSIEPVVVVGNSIEGCRIGIQLNPGSPTATITQTTIASNQIWGSNSGSAGISGRAIQITSAGSSFGQPTAGVTIAANYLQVDGGGTSSTSIIYIQNASYVNIAANTFGQVSGGTTALTQTSSLNVSIQDTANLRGSGVT